MLKSQYTKLCILNVIFYAFYYIGLSWEEVNIEPGGYGGFFGFSVLPAFLVFHIFYGCYSYAKTKNIVLPNVMLFVFVIAFQILRTLQRDKDVLITNIVMFACFFVGISVAFGLLTKFIYWLKSRKSNDTEDC